MKSAKLSNQNQTLTIDSEVLDIHTSQNFRQINFEFIQVNNLNGIIFCISNDNPQQPCRIMLPNGKTLNLNAVVDNTPYELKVKDTIRVMYLNEQDNNSFQRAIPYFKARLTNFMYRKVVSKAEYDQFTANWNKNNPNNTIDDHCQNILPPRQTIKDDILTVA